MFPSDAVTARQAATGVCITAGRAAALEDVAVLIRARRVFKTYGLTTGAADAEVDQAFYVPCRSYQTFGTVRGVVAALV